MADILGFINLLVLIFVAVFIATVIALDMEWKRQANKTIVQLQSDVAGVKNFTVRLDSSPQFRGSIGEDVVRTLLSELPLGTVEEQYNKNDIPGRPDFVVTLPGVTEKLVIDAKMSFPDETMQDGKFRQILKNRSEDLYKYIVPGTTFDFVLMWIPDGAYYKIDNELARNLFENGVVPVTTPTMLGVIHLLRRAHQAFRLNALTSNFMVFYQSTKQDLDKFKTVFNRGYGQLVNGMNNIDKTGLELNKLIDKVNSFEESLL